MFTGTPYEAVAEPSKVESVIAMLPTGPEGGRELWKLNHYYDRLDEFDQSHGLPRNPFAGPAAASDWELHNLSLDPEERDNRYGQSPIAEAELQSILETEREAKRLLPRLRNPSR
jgi:hypothetical protein